MSLSLLKRTAMKLYTQDEEIAGFRKAGRITARARDFGLSLIKPGVRLLDVAVAVEEEIRRLGGSPAFPAQISLNHVAAHYCSPHNDPLVFETGDVAKLDVGAHVNGYVGDTAGTVDLGGPPLLAEASRQALESALGVISPGVPVSEVGRAVHAAVTSMGFKPVANLTGHAVGIYQVHGEPQIPNIPEKSRYTFQKGQVLAIEPFATTGKGLVRERDLPEIFSVKGRLKPKTGMDPGVLETIASFQGLPFGRRNLRETHSSEAVNVTLSLLLRKGMLYAYPPLAEAEGVFISQAEHTIYIGDQVEILTLPE
ncbi:MAG: type II methionyl aminopeptidase [Planctomycetes bacterium]|nr:type II methionyl aminopeptidase [Planctomycetota bacterium]